MPVFSRLLRFTDFATHSNVVIKVPDPHSPTAFTLDSSGVAGFFGGAQSVAAMGTVHLLPFRIWGGWYNSPGSYEIAKQYGQLANSPVWDGLFPGKGCDPAKFFELDGGVGGRFLGAHSGTCLPQTGHLAHLLSRRVEDIEHEYFAWKANCSSPVDVTVIHLYDLPEGTISLRPVPNVHKQLMRFSGLFAVIPIAVSVAASVVCALLADWYCFTCITFGMFAGGVACAVIGSGRLVLSHPTAAPSAPTGDGILVGEKEMIVLLGEEAAVNMFTRGRFSLLEYPDGKEDMKGEEEEKEKKPVRALIGWCSIFLTLQFLIQLLLIPQGTLYGQISFVASLAVSWIYNIHVSSFDKERLQMDVLLKYMPELGCDIRQKRISKHRLPSWRTAVVLALMVLQDKKSMDDPRATLDELLPNNTLVWREWKDRVIASLKSPGSKIDVVADAKFKEDNDRELLEELCSDAEIVRLDSGKVLRALREARADSATVEKSSD